MQGVETVLIYIISIIVLSVIFSEIRFRFCLRREKSRGRIKEKSKVIEVIDERIDREPTVIIALKPLAYCCNPASYGCICVKCGKCGRKFKS